MKMQSQGRMQRRGVLLAAAGILLITVGIRRSRALFKRMRSIGYGSAKPSTVWRILSHP
jgi:hypothetical protein